MTRILLVEDDNSLIDGLTFTLEKNHYEVDVAKTVKEALMLHEKNRYDLFLLDLMLPDGSGFDICKKVRRESSASIIILTASDEEMSVVKGLDLGGDDYITKPFRLNELLARIQAVLRRSDMASDEKSRYLSIGDITVDLEECRVKKGENIIELTANEYRLLCLFIKNPNSVLGREQIMDKLWDGNGEFADDNTLSVYIRRLRNKIEDNPDNPQKLITIRGLGYKWKAD